MKHWQIKLDYFRGEKSTSYPEFVGVVPAPKKQSGVIFYKNKVKYNKRLIAEMRQTLAWQDVPDF